MSTSRCTRPLSPELIIKYSKLERVLTVDEVEHPIIREALQTGRDSRQRPRNHQHGGHPGWYGAWVVRQFHDRAAQGPSCVEEESRSSAELAEQACHIELEKLGEPIGKQDQYIAAYGGITCFKFHAQTARSRHGP